MALAPIIEIHEICELIMNLIKILTLTALISSLCACSTIQRHEATAQVIIQYAAIQALQSDQIKAERVKKVISAAILVIETDQKTSISGLEAAVRLHIHWGDLEPQDRLIVNSLIGLVGQELRNRVDKDPDIAMRLVLVKQVLMWIYDAAEIAALDE